ncbi:hypothetical protein Ssi03_45180 [Sphaerisporangium siamense]|uniref:Uncharacterized protein n=1 Tax=Sphaerisporangium siamense TaxID=795645 RepID=A0A7W7DF26_9ACTN|nr:hypothetical protein [Sphaerisporangium siamense]MBB4705319.1 hypothetical protein [Sphaerisporangium siamense]GII86528.1 hypothetical protein Ssi03_45180 [Sphaerisporangium siamense]
MEAWDAEPPAPGDPWAEAGQVIYLSPGGIVLLCGPMHSPSGQMLLLGPPFFAYGLRAYAGTVRTQAADYDETVTEAVEESWLLRFWPLADAAGPALRAEPEGDGRVLAKMGEILPLEPGSAAPQTVPWPALHPLPEPVPPTGVLVRFSPPAQPERVPSREAPGSISLPRERLDLSQRIKDTLADLQHDMLGNPHPPLGGFERTHGPERTRSRVQRPCLGMGERRERPRRRVIGRSTGHRP